MGRFLTFNNFILTVTLCLQTNKLYLTCSTQQIRWKRHQTWQTGPSQLRRSQSSVITPDCTILCRVGR